MSLPQLVRNSPDLTRLVNDGYAVRVLSGHLLIDDVPFVTAERLVSRGTLVCPLDLNGDSTSKPGTHVMWFSGGVPHTSSGTALPLHENRPHNLADDIAVVCSLSQKPSPDGYANYYDKVATYVGLIAGHAAVIDPAVTATTFRPVETDEDTTVFKYIDTASSRAGITIHSDKLAKVTRVAIVGLGGTGAYLLDLLAKTPIREIHLFDGDVFSTHNAFRAPGVASLEELRATPLKVDHYALKYEPLRRNIIAHAQYVTADNVADLGAMDFVFLALDAGEDKRAIVEHLSNSDVPFIDTGIGVQHRPDGLHGQVRVTTSLPGQRAHVTGDQLISYASVVADGYETNIQVAELNALAATTAVIAFKKKVQFYRDEAHELHTVYRIDTNDLINEHGDDHPDGGEE